MDKYRFQICQLLHQAKQNYLMQNDYEHKTLISLSVDTGITTSNLSKILSGVQVPSLLNFLKILDAFECRITLDPVDTFKAFPELKNFYNKLQSQNNVPKESQLKFDF